MTHELSLMTDLLRKIDEVVRQDGGAGRVVSVRVRLGALANISADHFRGHFVDAARGTVAEGAELEIDSSDDRTDPRAQDITLESVEVAI
jgi:hydrogenase nickel incorporation protein HypA/HybF